jgi:hypothetical protein
MSTRNIVFGALLLFTLAATSAFADGPKPANAIGFDVYGVSYNQYAFSYERMVARHTSVGVALGYSPQALFNFYGAESDYTSYFLFQLDAKSYLSGDRMKDLYFGCGAQFDLAPNPLNFKYGDAADHSSAVLAVYAEIGWKWLLQGDAGWYVDPCFLVYAAAPIKTRIRPEAGALVWGYKLLAPMMSVTLGYAL